MEILLLSKRIRFGCCCCRRWCCSHLAIGNISTPNWKAMFLTFSLSYAFSEKVPSVCAYLSIYRRRLCICIIWKLTVNWRVANWKGTEQKEQKSTDSNDGPVVLIFVAVDVAGVWAGAGTPLCIRQAALQHQTAAARPGRKDARLVRLPLRNHHRRLLLLPIWVAVSLSLTFCLSTQLLICSSLQALRRQPLGANL